MRENKKKVNELVNDINNEFPTALIIKGTKTQTSISLSIPGYVNTPLRKTKKRKAAAEKPATATPEIIPTKTSVEISPEDDEMELRAIMQNPILRADLSTETLLQAEEFLRRKNTEERVKILLARLTKK